MLFNIIEFKMMRGVANSITGLVSNQIALNRCSPDDATAQTHSIVSIHRTTVVQSSPGSFCFYEKFYASFQQSRCQQLHSHIMEKYMTLQSVYQQVFQLVSVYRPSQFHFIRFIYSPGIILKNGSRKISFINFVFNFSELMVIFFVQV